MNTATNRKRWKVACYQDEKRRRFLFNRFCSSKDRYRAEAWARKAFSCAAADAFPFRDPEDVDASQKTAPAK